MRNVTVLRLITLPGQGEHAVIGTGLAAHDSVVSEGQSQLAPGTHVRVLPANVVPAT